MMLAYEFCNRHPVIRELQVADSPAAVEELRKLFAAVFFVGQAPPAAFPPGQRFGAMIVLVPLVSAAP